MCTLIDAFPGAMPPLIGQAATSGRLSLQPSVLYAVLFLWQCPHFMAIAWMCREGYARTGLLGTSFWGTTRTLHRLAKRSAGSCPDIRQPGSEPTGPCQSHLFRGSLATQLQLSLLRSQLGSGRSNAARTGSLFVSIIDSPLLFVLMMLDKI